MQKGSWRVSRLAVGLGLMVLVGCFILLARRGQPAKAGDSAPTTTVSTVVVKPGELLLRGVILSHNDAANGKTRLEGFEMKVQSVQDANGHVTPLNPPRTKWVMVSQQTQLDLSGSAHFQDGTSVSVVGQDLGAGKPMPARGIILDPGPIGSTRSTTPAHPALPGAAAEVTIQGYDLPFLSQGKGKLFTCSKGGRLVAGHCVTRDGIREWTWSPKSGLKSGKKLANGPEWSRNPHAPEQRLRAWHGHHGWDHMHGSNPGPDTTRLGSTSSLLLIPTDAARDSSVVVGDSLCTSPTQGESMGYPNGVSVYDRCFVWVRGQGYCDLWDLGGPQVVPQGETDSTSCAVSPDGRTIALLTDRLYIIQAPASGFKLPKALTLPG